MCETNNKPEEVKEVTIDPTIGELIEKKNQEILSQNPDAEEIHEEDPTFGKLRETWFNIARRCTEETLPDFIHMLMHNYIHDYGTICHAMAAAAIAAAWACDHSDQGGITGMQASFVMWGFIRDWEKRNNKCGLRLIDFDDMLYPQYEEKFNSRTISPMRFNNLQKAAKELLEESKDENGEFVGHAKEVLEHWQSIVDGKVPFGWTISEDD